MKTIEGCIEISRRKVVDGTRAGWDNSKAGTGPRNPKVWADMPQRIMDACQRLKNAQIENTDAVELIRAYNASDCLIYADPPYLRNTRGTDGKCGGKRIYRCEMLEEAEHAELLTALKAHKGPVMLSGYDNELYNNELDGWNKIYVSSRSDSGAARTEVVWYNFDRQISLWR